MYTLNNVAKFLNQNQINILKLEESTDWQVEDDCIYLEYDLALQIGEDYIGISREKTDGVFTNYGYYKKSKGLIVMIKTLIDRFKN
jgi:hypothetical protein